MKPLAKALIDRFGDFAGVLAADPRRIAEGAGAGEQVALDLKAIQAALERAMRATARKGEHAGSWSKLIDYCRIAMQHETREQSRVLFLDLFLDVKNTLLSPR